MNSVFLPFDRDREPGTHDEYDFFFGCCFQFRSEFDDEAARRHYKYVAGFRFQFECQFLHFLAICHWHQPFSAEMICLKYNLRETKMKKKSTTTTTGHICGKESDSASSNGRRLWKMELMERSAIDELKIQLWKSMRIRIARQIPVFSLTEMTK